MSVQFSISPDRRGGLTVCYSEGAASLAAVEVTGEPTSITKPDPTTIVVVGPKGRTKIRVFTTEDER